MQETRTGPECRSEGATKVQPPSGSIMEGQAFRTANVLLIAEPSASACGCDSPLLHWSRVYGYDPRRVYFYCARCDTLGTLAFPAESWMTASVLDGQSAQGLLDRATSAFQALPDLPELLGIFRRVANDVFDRRSVCSNTQTDSVKGIASRAVDAIQRSAQDSLERHLTWMRTEQLAQARLTDQLSRKVSDRRKASAAALNRRKPVERSEFSVLVRGRDNHGVTIYGLIDPREPQRVRYVGQAKHPARRLAGHISSGSASACNKKDQWIAALVDVGVYPDMVLLERTRPGADPDTLERWWIAQMVAKGQADLNTASVPKPSSAEVLS